MANDTLNCGEGENGQSVSPGQRPSAGYVWYVIFLLSVVNVFNLMDRMALSVLLPSIKADLNLSDGELGLLVGFAFSVFYAICGIPIARWADRGVRRNIIALALMTWSVMTALSGAAQSFLHLFAARVGVGAGEAGGLAPAQSILCDYVPLKHRSGVFALHTLGLVVGLMIGMVLSGWLGETIGWRWTFVALGLPGVVLAIIVRLTLREPVRGFFDAVKEEKPVLPLRQTFAVLWGCRTYRLLMYMLVVSGFVHHGMYQWLPSFYARVFGLGLSSVGVNLGVAIGTGSGIGLLLGGFLAHKAAQRDARLPLKICAATTTLALPTALGSLFIPSAIGSMLLVLLTVLFWSVSSGPVLATLYSVTRPRMRATGGAITVFFTSVLGFGLGPFCVGVLSDMLTPSTGVEALRYALLAPVFLLPAIVVVLYRAAQALPNDLRALGAPIQEARDHDYCQSSTAGNLSTHGADPKIRRGRHAPV